MTVLASRQWPGAACVRGGRRLDRRHVPEEAVHEWMRTTSGSSAASGSSLIAPVHGVMPREMAQRWIKIELLCTHPRWFGHKVGTILLLAALYWAHTENKEHGILSVAGGSNNVPAVRLYEKFGFRPVRADAFHPPNEVSGARRATHPPPPADRTAPPCQCLYRRRLSRISSFSWTSRPPWRRSTGSSCSAPAQHCQRAPAQSLPAPRPTSSM